MTLAPEWSKPRIYDIVGGRVVTHALQVHATDHCNLRCAQCCALSPHLPPFFIEKEALERDLSSAAKVLAPSILKLVGGEPLLHPEIATLAHIAKQSGVAPIVSLTTNGLLLDRAPDALFEALDAITVSVYPRPEISRDAIEARAREHGVKVTFKEQDAFQEMTLGRKRDSSEVVHQTCWLRHRCHTIFEGRFFACNKPQNLNAFRRDRAFDGDGVHVLSDASTIKAYLEREAPLDACSFCLGSTGTFAPHRLLRKEELGRLEA